MGWTTANIEVCTRGRVCGGGGQIRLSVFSLLYGTQRRKTAPGGMASQHLRTFERVLVNKELFTRTVLVDRKLLTGTVLVN